MRKVLISALCVVTLAACAQPGQQGYAPPGEAGLNKTTGGALVGAGLGGLAGSQLGHGSGKIATTALGVVLGGLLGGSVGASLDRADQAALDRSTQTALESTPTNQPVQWQNPDTGHYGTIVPVRTYQPQPGSFCREFQQTVVIGGQSQQAYGTACRQPDGTWKVQQS
ncbi:MAG TPA: RT0821/Lpp0805 family surface protein [Aliidongia sp.]|nr:RT0821/Lpp0805 family surface protein [Aliidongia sp.]